MQTESKQKKDFLKRYIVLCRREVEIQQEIDAIRTKYTGQAVRYSDMPKAHNSEHDLSDYAVEVEELLTTLSGIQAEAVETYQSISTAIEQIPDVYQRQVLRVRYLQNVKDWERIGEAIGYSKRQAQRIHGRALMAFILPEHGV